ncbi:MAG: hypothetical protein QNJ27_00535 [Simkaniaceae bacterium]|nr:hypothetical protein [Simkaniaceae bacterium]
MKKWLLIFLAVSLFSFANEKEEKAQELCTFTKEIFLILEDQVYILESDHLAKVHASSIEKLHVYEKGGNPELAALAQEFISSLKNEKNANEALGDAVTSLGRLVKCSADDDFRTDSAFLLHKEDVQSVLQFMEERLAGRLPKKENSNFHKIMVESLADQKYDMALYAYFKITETRCQKS